MDQGGETWEIGPVKISYDSAAAKVMATVTAATLTAAAMY